MTARLYNAPNLPHLTLSAMVILLVTSLTPTAQLSADVLDITLPIDQVTVHPTAAIVNRVGTVAIPQGDHQLIISNLPPILDPARLQLSIDNNNVRLGSLELKQVHDGGRGQEDERRLQDELNRLHDQRNVIVDEINTANTELSLLTALTKGGVGSGLNPTINGEDLASVIRTVSSSSTDARRRIREANVRVRPVDEEIERVRFELQQIGTRRLSHTEVVVAISATSSGTTQLSLSYPVRNAGWSWLYEARVNTDTSILRLARRVTVYQGAGEDWDNVNLTVTTAMSSANAITPELNSLLVDIFQPPTQRLTATAAPSQRDGRMPQGRRALGGFADMAITDMAIEEIVVTGSKLSAGIVSSQYLVDYQIPGRVTVNADRQNKVFPIDEKSFEVSLVTRIVPDIDTGAYLEARFSYDETVPMQAGRVQLYRDGAFVGNGQIPAFLPGEEVRLPVGRDERIRVEIRNLEEESREGGSFNRNSVDNHRIRYEISSFHPQPVLVELVSRVPVSQNDRIEVDIDSDATPAKEKGVDGKSGVLLWEVTVKPRVKSEINHFYSITYPKDDGLNFEESRQ